MLQLLKRRVSFVIDNYVRHPLVFCLLVSNIAKYILLLIFPQIFVHTLNYINLSTDCWKCIVSALPHNQLIHIKIVEHQFPVAGSVKSRTTITYIKYARTT